MIYKEIKAAWVAYLRHVESNPEPELPPSENLHVSENDNLVRASALGRCPLKSALERRGIRPRFPLTDAEQLSIQQNMRRGTVVGRDIQKALYWYYGDRVQTEVVLRSDVWMMKGHADAIYTDADGKRHVIEIKCPNPERGAEFALPQVAYCFQALAYAFMSGADYAHILIVNAYYFKLWTLEFDNGRYTITDEAGEQWIPEHEISGQALMEEVDFQMSYLAHEDNTEPPFPMIGHARSWMCGKWEGGVKPMRYKKTYQGREYRTGTLIRRCDHWCHSDQPGPYIVGITEEGEHVIEQDLSAR